MTAIDTTMDSLTLVMQFTYRGEDELYSQTYFMTGDTPSSPSSWHTLAQNVANALRPTLPTDQTIVAAIGHVAGESVAVWSVDFVAESDDLPGTYDVSTRGDVEQSGDTALWLRWPTDQKTSKGKPIYLRNYWHPGITHGAALDAASPGWIAVAETFGEAWVSGFADGDSTEHHRAGPHGVVALSGAIGSPFVTTRTLERRGRRLPPA